MHLVLSTYRSGSTWFCKELARELDVVNHDEPFNNRINDEPDKHKNFLAKLKENPVGVVKIFPYHLNHTPIYNLLETCISLSETITVLVRKNFDDQVKSYYIAKQLKNWHDDINTTITLDKSIYFDYVKFLNNQNNELSKIYKSLPQSKLVFLEDLSSFGKYNNRIFHWNKYPKETNINTEKLFV